MCTDRRLTRPKPFPPGHKFCRTLKALAVFPKGDCWQGGGLWTSNNNYWVNDGFGHSVLYDTQEVQRDRRYEPSADFGGECRGVYYPRLLRDGWQLMENVNGSKWKDQDVFEKQLDHGWSLRKIAHAEMASPDGRGCYWDEHQLVPAQSDTEVDCPDWEWAELDKYRVVWASGGRLYSGFVEPNGLVNETELFDLNPMRFESIEAPY